MPVITKSRQQKISTELSRRYENLIYLLEGKELSSNRDGAGKGCWTHPQLMCTTVGSNFEISLAIEDFKSILTEIKKLK